MTSGQLVNEIYSLWIKSGCHNKFSDDEMNFIFLWMKNGYSWTNFVYEQ